MNREETKQIISIIVKTFPNSAAVDKGTIDAWYFFLADYNYNDVAIALKTYVTTSGSAFAPNPSQLIEYARKVNKLAELDEVEAWNMVRKAIGRGSSDFYRQQDWDSFPDSVKRAVGSPAQLFSWATDVDFNEAVVSSVFQKNYRTILERKDTENRLPMEANMQLEALRKQVLQALPQQVEYQPAQIEQKTVTPDNFSVKERMKWKSEFAD